MEPVAVGQKGGDYVLVHECTQCTHSRKNKVAHNDDMRAVIAIAEKNK